MLPQLVQWLLNDLYVLFALVLSIDENVIEVHYHKNVVLLCQDLVDITLKRGRRVSQAKKHDLIFEMTQARPESHLPLVTFPDPHLIVSISQIEQGKMSSLI